MTTAPSPPWMRVGEEELGHRLLQCSRWTILGLLFFRSDVGRVDTRCTGNPRRRRSRTRHHGSDARWSPSGDRRLPSHPRRCRRRRPAPGHSGANGVRQNARLAIRVRSWGIRAAPARRGCELVRACRLRCGLPGLPWEARVGRRVREISFRGLRWLRHLGMDRRATVVRWQRGDNGTFLRCARAGRAGVSRPAGAGGDGHRLGRIFQCLPVRHPPGWRI